MTAARIAFEWIGDGANTPTGTAVFRFRRGEVRVRMLSFAEAHELSFAMDAERDDVADEAKQQVGAAVERMMRDRGWL